jgi:hypothetical protein
LASAFVVRWTLRRSRTGRDRLPRRLLWSAVASVAVYTWPLLVHGLLGGQPLRKILGLPPSQDPTPMTFLLGLVVFRPASIVLGALVLGLGFASAARYDRR